MYPLLIILLMFLGLFIYSKTKNYLTWKGILLAIIILLSIYLRMRYVDISHSKLFDFQLIPFVPYLLSLILVYIVTRRDIPILKKKILHFLKLLPLYILFGVIQQFIFLFIVTDTLFFLTKDYYIAGIVSVIYYYLFHIMYKDKLKTYLPYLLLFSIVNVFVYLYFDTILPQIVFHGILGTLVFTIGTEEDLIEERF
jgi:hypothetical protein